MVFSKLATNDLSLTPTDVIHSDMTRVILYIADQDPALSKPLADLYTLILGLVCKWDAQTMMENERENVPRMAEYFFGMGGLAVPSFLRGAGFEDDAYQILLQLAFAVARADGRKSARQAAQNLYTLFKLQSPGLEFETSAPPNRAFPSQSVEGHSTAQEIIALLDNLDAQLAEGKISEETYGRLKQKWEARLSELRPGREPSGELG